ncbi:CCR4-NOT transcription complex subunit 11 isoform 6 [Schistosoma japonicum]|nr:CCR4-NOT transcription complex subunit 11 isoform 6 [Schistosoma japonicum]
MFCTILRQPDRICDVCTCVFFQYFSKLVSLFFSIEQFLKYTPSQIFNLPYSMIDTQLDWNLASLANSLKSFTRVPKFADSGMICVVPDEDIPYSFEPSFHLHNTSDSSGISELQRQCLDSLLSRSELLTCRNNIFPEFLRIAPPLMPCPQGTDEILCNFSEEHESDSRAVSNSSNSLEKKPTLRKSQPTYGWSEELTWLNPDIVEHDFHWNNSMELVDMAVEIRHLISAAMTSTLTQSQQQTIVQAIKENPNVVYNVGITSDILPNFINRNPVIAIEVLQLLISSPKRDEYLNALLKMEVTVQSIEVVNRLSTKIALPTEFIQNYISNCLSFCYSVHDKFYQMRHVRLVCVLLQSLIRNNILDIHNQDILIEVRTFCLEFTKAREATTLHRLILNMENNTTFTAATTHSSNIGTSTTTTSSTCLATSTPQQDISSENPETP